MSGREHLVRKAGVAGIAALALSLVSCTDGCPQIRQTVVLTSPDADLHALVDACSAHLPTTGETCAPPMTQAPIECGCRTLCRRALEIIDQFPGPETIESCHYLPPSASSSFGGSPGFSGAGRVEIAYRPSQCP
jgi:hypothetical protein